MRDSSQPTCQMSSLGVGSEPKNRVVKVKGCRVPRRPESGRLCQACGKCSPGHWNQERAWSVSIGYSCSGDCCQTAGKGSSIKEAGNRAPEGTKVTAELATCRGKAQPKSKQRGLRVADTEPGGQRGLRFRRPKCPWLAGRSQSWTGAVCVLRPHLPLACVLAGVRINKGLPRPPAVS